MRPTPALALTLSLTAVLAPSIARAQASTGERVWDESTGHRFTLEQGLAYRQGVWPRGGRGLFCRSTFPGVALSTDDCAGQRELWADVLQLGARVQVHPDEPSDDRSGTLRVEITSALRMMLNERSRTGPLFVGASLAWRTPELTLRATLGLGIPVFLAFDRADAPYVSEEDQLMRGAFGHEGAWLADRRFPIVLQLALEWRHELVFAGGDAAASAMVGWGEWRYAAQLGAFVGVQPIDVLALGARVQLVVEGQPETDDWLVPIPAYVAWHASIVPFVRLDTRPVFAEARLLLDLDDTSGLAFEPGAIWSLTLTVGAELF